VMMKTMLGRGWDIDRMRLNGGGTNDDP
jgi:hypothetical protein